jgi:hypothetical protein
VALLLLVVSPDGPGVSATLDHPRAAREDGAAASRAGAAYRNLPLRFEANGGQVDAPVDFLARGRDYTVFLTPSEAVVALRQPAAGAPAQAGEGVVGVDLAPRERGEDEHPASRAQPSAGGEAAGTDGPRRAVLRLQLVGANPRPRAVGRDVLPGRVSYFRGNAAQWRSDIPSYERVSYGNVYPGVDLVYHGSREELGYELVVAPGADPGAISVRFQGADRMEIDAGGGLTLHTASGEVRHR